MGRAPALFFSMDWSLTAQQALENRRRFGDHRYMIVRYEDICSKPQETMPKIAGFLRIEFDPILLRPTKVGVSAPAAITTQRRNDSENSITASRIRESNIDNWQKDLSAGEKLLIEVCCSTVMQHPELNYAVDHPRPLLRLGHGALSRALSSAYYGKKLLKGLLSPSPLHELYRIDKSAFGAKRFGL